MPLYFPDEHKPDLSWSHIAELRCRDCDTERIVPVMVWDRCMEGHAIAAGWPEPLGKYDRAKMLGDVLGSVVLQASEEYDALGKPPGGIEMHDERSSTPIRCER
jgi:hypothetical protein